MEDNIKMDHERIGCKNVDRILRLQIGSSEGPKLTGGGPWDSVKVKELLDQLCNYKLLEKVSAPLS
jgi:hypothetical protein